MGFCYRLFNFFTVDDDQVSSTEEYDDLDSGEEASISDDGDSYTQQDNSDVEPDQDSTEKNEEKHIIYGNFGWADAMSKVLKSSKPKAKKSVILSKAQKDADILKIMAAQDSGLPFEIEGEIKKENVDQDPEVARRNDHIEKMLRRRRRKEWDLVGRVLPSITEDREREKVLSKIATRYE